MELGDVENGYRRPGSNAQWYTAVAQSHRYVQVALSTGSIPSTNVAPTSWGGDNGASKRCDLSPVGMSRSDECRAAQFGGDLVGASRAMAQDEGRSIEGSWIRS